MAHFNVWIPATTDSYVEILLGRLVSHGWVVGRLGSLTLSESENIGTVLSFDMTRTVTEGTVEPTPASVRDELVKTMKLLGMTYFGIIVCIAGASAAWAASNVPKCSRDLDEAVH